MAAVATENGTDGETKRQEEEAEDALTHVVVPSHVLQDGRFIDLPPPTDAERAQFFERSVAKYNLIRADESGLPSRSKKDEEEKENKDNSDETSTKIHPLAVASARLNANGIEELSKAINLAGLVSSGEYFGLTNIVNPIVSSAEGGTSAAGVSSGGGTSSESARRDETLRAAYSLKRKRKQLEQATEALTLHHQRLSASVVAQSVIDERLLLLRKRWRLAAPEHGTRSIGPVRPTEVVALDVDVYDRDRTRGGSQALKKGGTGKIAMSLGRIARMVPRYATVELRPEYNVKDDLEKRQSSAKSESASTAMTEDDAPLKETQQDDGSAETSTVDEKTMAEPFAVLDPMLGKVDLDFDPDKVKQLTFLLQIEKSSTGFVQQAALSPLNTVSGEIKNGKIKASSHQGADEKVVVALQHSLFCASLFESIRQEIADDGATASTAGIKSKPRVTWLSSEMDDSFLPSPSHMAGEGSLCIVHCHEGEVKVLLNSEYTVTVELVEAGRATGAAPEASSVQVEGSSKMKKCTSTTNGLDSGSQSPQQLKALCRALLLHAQSVFHKHSIEAERRPVSLDKVEQKGMGHAKKQKETIVSSPKILQSCVQLGARMLLEREIRATLKRLKQWLSRQIGTESAKLMVEWLPLSLFDLHARFAMCFRDLSLDVALDDGNINITSIRGNGTCFQSVSLRSNEEFETYLMLQFRAYMKASCSSS